MDDKNANNALEPKYSIERLIQQVFGGLMWAWLMFTDYKSGIELSELSNAQLMFIVGKYTVAFILIKGVTIKELTELLRAWKGKA